MTMLKKIKGAWVKFDWPNHLWMAGNLLADRFSLVTSTVIGKWTLRAHGCRKIGKGLRVKGLLHVFTRRNESIEIGDNVTMVSRFRSNPVGITNPCVLDTLMGGAIRIGNNVGMSGVIISSRSSVEIGNCAKLGGNVRVFDHNFHSLDPAHRRDGDLDSLNVRTAPVVIGCDVFVGTNAIILKGVTIGEEAVIGAGSVVSCDIPAGEVWGGNPAKCLKKKCDG